MSQADDKQQSLTGNQPKMEAHQLAKDCYPPTDSDEDSFEVLDTDSDADERRKHEEEFTQEVKAQLLSSDGIDCALDMASEQMMSAMTLQSLPQMPPLQQMQESFMSTSTDMSSVSAKLFMELQDKVKDLKEENIVLRSTLAQQSLVTKTHSDILTTWKEDVERVHESHKQKFEKMKALIEQLKKENKQLKQMLGSYSSMSDSTEKNAPISSGTPEPNPKHEQELKDQQTKHEKELQEKQDELQQLKTELDQTNIKFTDSTLELQKIKDELQMHQQQSLVIVQQAQQKTTLEQEQFDKLVADKEVQHEKIVNLLQEEKNATERQLQDLKVAHIDELQNMESKLQLEISALQQQLSGNEKQAQADLQQLLQKTKDDLKNITDELNSTKELNEQQMLRINDLKSKLVELSKVHDMMSLEFIKSKVEFSECRNTLADRCYEVVQLQEEVEERRREIIALRASVEAKIYLEEQLADYKKQVMMNDDDYKRMESENQEASKKEQQLYTENVNLKCQLLKMKNDETAELQRLRIQLSEAQNSLVELKEAKKTVEKEAADNRQAVDEIDRRYKAARCDQDKILALEEQLKVYHADYKTERERKQFVVDELNKVSQDLENVQLRNRELIDEIERLRAAQDFVNVASQRPASQSNTPSPPLSRFACPLCSQVFRSLRAVEEHVELCINNSPL